MTEHSHLTRIIAVMAELTLYPKDMKAVARTYGIKIVSHKDSINNWTDYVLEGKYCDLKTWYEQSGASTGEPFDEWLEYSEMGDTDKLSPETDQELEIGLQSKGNIVRAFEALLSANIYCELDLPSNWRTMGIFYFKAFQSKEELNRATIVIAEAIGVGLELEEDWPNTVDEVKEMINRKGEDKTEQARRLVG